ncbi:tripartite ATP-independent transporter solute receptor, DctP family [Reichenbachiella faecimaris]|uniref:Tripartite ATP-independent transporter solute receptor, DctP family n=1 Tax=Reichenbachiella faecimaris TaxID=692418 RepID=A0A1W2G6P8_REIFA|nr:TRAP transporter substrate-binding protein [Reichenbachiella faecimaris]SMD32293.1 tripartite ATP-independent transporter solute receptor, DctP family [Reichenbachiella faecimaris]
MKIRTHLIGFVLLVNSMCLLSCNSEKEVRVLKLAHELNETHPVHIGMVEMARLLDEISKGQLTIDIYANGQLGKERDLLELLQIGSLDMTKVSAGALENFVPEIKVLTLPYLFRDSAHTAQVLQGSIGKRLLMKGSNYRLRGLCFFDAGSRSFYSKEAPIQRPEDLAGLKIRVMNSQSAFDMINTLGGTPTPVSFGELYTALQQGVVDAAENNPPSFFTSRHYEICKHYSIDEHTTIPDVLIVSTYLWNSLTDQQKEWLQEAADRAVNYQKKVWAASVAESLEQVKAAGVTVYYPNKSPFQATVEPLYQQYKTDPELYQLIQEITAINQPLKKKEDER